MTIHSDKFEALRIALPRRNETVSSVVLPSRKVTSTIGVLPVRLRFSTAAVKVTRRSEGLASSSSIRGSSTNAKRSRSSLADLQGNLELMDRLVDGRMCVAMVRGGVGPGSQRRLRLA